MRLRTTRHWQLLVPALLVSTLFVSAASSDAAKRVKPFSKGGLSTAVEVAQQYNTGELLIWQDGETLRHERWMTEPVRDIASIQKSVIAVLVGIAVQKGLVDVETPVSTYIGAGWTEKNAGEEPKILVRHLLEMSSGLSRRLTQQGPPGTIWFYNTPAYHHLKLVLEATSGMSLNELTQAWLGEPLGWTLTTWERRAPAQFSPKGPRKEDVLATGLLSNAEELLSFGRMILDRGQFNGKTVIEDDDYFHAMLTTTQTLRASYGYLWWLNDAPFEPLRGRKTDNKGRSKTQRAMVLQAPRDLVAAKGSGDQRLYVLPGKRAVIIRLSKPGFNRAAGVFDRPFWEALNR